MVVVGWLRWKALTCLDPAAGLAVAAAYCFVACLSCISLARSGMHLAFVWLARTPLKIFSLPLSSVTAFLVLCLSSS